MSRVESPLVARGVLPDGLGPEIPMVLRFDADDCFAVRMVFAADGVTVEWFIARDVLTAGLKTASGVGDVFVWPTPSRGVLSIQLTSPSGSATLEMDASRVDLFLAATEAVVASESESEVVDVDAIVAQILAVSK